MLKKYHLIELHSAWMTFSNMSLLQVVQVAMEVVSKVSFMDFLPPAFHFLLIFWTLFSPSFFVWFDVFFFYYEVFTRFFFFFFHSFSPQIFFNILFRNWVLIGVVFFLQFKHREVWIHVKVAVKLYFLLKEKKKKNEYHSIIFFLWN